MPLSRMCPGRCTPPRMGTPQPCCALSLYNPSELLHLARAFPTSPRTSQSSPKRLRALVLSLFSHVGQAQLMGAHSNCHPQASGVCSLPPLPRLCPAGSCSPPPLNPNQEALQGTQACAGPTGEPGTDPLSAVTSSAQAIFSVQGSPSCTPLPLCLLFIFSLWETSIFPASRGPAGGSSFSWCQPTPSAY